MALQDDSPSPGLPNSPSEGLCKFGSYGPDWQPVPHKYPGVWAKEKTSGPNRLAIAPESERMELLLKLCKPMREPFGVLYILVSARGAPTAGRYESPNFLSREDLVQFLKRFRPYFESGGRHHIWVRSIAESDLLVYDNHNLIYGYGCLNQFEVILRSEGLLELPKVVIPYPHTHFFHEEFDEEQQKLLSFYDWKYSPLRDEDE